MTLNDLFTDLRVAQIEQLATDQGTIYILHLESMTSDLLGCRISLAAEAFDKLERTGEPWPEVQVIS